MVGTSHHHAYSRMHAYNRMKKLVSLYFVINIRTMNFGTIQCRCGNLLLCFTLDARISNILIFMRHFFHQTNKSFYLHSLIFNAVSVFSVCLSMNQVLRKPTCTWEGRQQKLPYMQKSREALANARKSIPKRIENKQ